MDIRTVKRAGRGGAAVRALPENPAVNSSRETLAAMAHLRAADEKESRRWLHGVEIAAEWLEGMGGLR